VWPRRFVGPLAYEAHVLIRFTRPKFGKRKQDGAKSRLRSQPRQSKYRIVEEKSGSNPALSLQEKRAKEGHPS
jgi:hypothetical protein